MTLPPPYPLAWPDGRARVQHREQGRYNVKTVPEAIGLLERELLRWSGRDRDTRIIGWELTTDQTVRSQPADPGASLWFMLGGKDITGEASLMVIACDKFRALAQNIRAICLTMERLRLVDEVGAYSLVAAVEGARALPPPDKMTPLRPWHEVLEFVAKGDCKDIK